MKLVLVLMTFTVLGTTVSCKRVDQGTDTDTDTRGESPLTSDTSRVSGSDATTDSATEFTVDTEWEDGGDAVPDRTCEACTAAEYCDRTTDPPACRPVPTGQGTHCTTEADCAGFDADYCENMVAGTCLVSGCDPVARYLTVSGPANPGAKFSLIHFANAQR